MDIDVILYIIINKTVNFMIKKESKLNSLDNYVHDEAVHNIRSAEVFLPILMEYIHPISVIDVGCGLGTWLKVFENFGVKDLLGIDGNYIDRSKLQIDSEKFLLHDLTKYFKYSKKFDLAICLEVVEHLPENASDVIVETLTGLSDTILFSAALLYQGGQNHINEQSFSYWIKKFNQRGFIVKDVFRDRIWNEKKIEWWYRQNMFLVVKSDEKQNIINDYYHPDNYLDKVKMILGTIDICNFKQALIIIKISINLVIRSIVAMFLLLFKKIIKK